MEQLKTQVTDLERYIHFLQLAQDAQAGSICTKGTTGSCTCSCPMHGNAQTGIESYDPLIAMARQKMDEMAKKKLNGSKSRTGSESGESRDAIKMIRRVMTLLQMITYTQFGCARGTQDRRFERNTLKKTTKGNPAGQHFGDLRARLELSIDHILEIDKEKLANDSDYTSDSDEPSHHAVHGNDKMTSVVRKELAVAIRDLLEHGLVMHASNSSNSNSLIASTFFDWGCFAPRSAQVVSSSVQSGRSMSGWDLFVKFYELKNGSTYRASPARRLSQSYNLHIVGGVAITPKHTLLMAIDEIIETHTPLKRSPDSHFKAFVSQALK